MHKTSRAAKITVTGVLLNHHGQTIVIDPDSWNHADMWDTILCPDVLVSRRELLLLVAERMQTSRNLAGMKLVAQCEWHIGRHLTVTSTSETRIHYWCCGTHNRVGQCDRKWATWVEVEGYDGKGTRKTSRLAFLVCAIQLKNIKKAMGTPLPEALREVVGKEGEDSVTFFLVRYAAPHQSVTQRGPEHRPLCPGPFQHTHCLWTWATRPEGHVRGCFRPRPWERHKKYFGSVPEQQNKLRLANSLAWYDLIQVSNIRCFTNVHVDPDPVHDQLFLQSVVYR